MNILSRKTTSSTLPCILLAGLFFSSSTVMASDYDNDQCNLSIKNDLSVTPEHIRILKGDETLVEIYQDKSLFIKGEDISLSNEQQKMLIEYATSIRNVIPEQVEMSIEAVGLMRETFKAEFGPLIDIEETDKKFTEVQQEIRNESVDKIDSYFIKKGEFSVTWGDEKADDDGGSIGDFIDVMVEDMLPGLMSSFSEPTIDDSSIDMGNDLSGLLGDFDEVESKAEQELEEKSKLFEMRFEVYCKKMEQTDKLEQKLIDSNSEFTDLDLLDLGKIIKATNML
ncbi:DUF2884 family protein [uncultured Psychrosphaera sp.]|uniref:DUF2884 family protein n=1 Tax=uncultured Psychrosphaera sp. TaxID=1403522 RepID=UPI00263730A4|nr:DUF2884 family protein [uncultured Psychrosphaera sp.]